MTNALLLAAMVVIRTYNYGQVPPEELAHARATADRIFHQTGITLQWIDCWVPEDRPASIVDRPSSCTEPMREGRDVVLRLMSSSIPLDQPLPRKVVMGISLIDHDSRIGALTTVDPALVLQIARGAGAEVATLLGRALAHEIGHLLLGHPQHSRSGLMRATWTREEIGGIRPADWQFSAAEGAQMRHGLAASTGAAN